MDTFIFIAGFNEEYEASYEDWALSVSTLTRARMVTLWASRIIPPISPHWSLLDKNESMVQEEGKGT